ncbi:MAG: TraR/DksA C4-type zinc finger protein [Verrucomicrobiota bacterium]
MSAKKKPAPKAPAKPAKKTAAKAAKPAPKTKAKAPVGKTAKPSSPPKKTSVKKTPAKTASAPKAAPAAKSAPAKKAAASPAPTKKEAAPAPAKKAAAAPVAKKAAEPAPAPAKKAAPAPAPAPAPKAAKAPAAAPAKAAPISTTSSKGPAVKVNVKRHTNSIDEGITLDSPPKKPVLPAAFLKKQKLRLAELRDIYLNAAEGVTNENLRNNDSTESAFGMHQADAGSDAYDRDFALSLLAKEQDAIYEINEALKRIEQGTYGICEMSGDLISEERLEALPFTRFTVISQAKIESEQRGGRWTRPVRSLFGLDESADSDDDDDDDDAAESSSSSKSNQGANESLDFSKE